MYISVLEKIVEKRRMPVLFIGSGISKRYLYKYPDWEELLDLSYHKTGNDAYQLQKYKDQFTRQNLSQFEINTKIASIIEDEFNAAFFDRKIKLGRVKNPAWVKRGISPYKMFLAQYFKDMALYKSAKTADELIKLKALKNKISAVITTNFDLFLETEVFANDFKVFVHQNELFSADSYNIAEIYKIHGSATDANSIIITENDYEHFADTRKLIIAKMLTLFAESPIVFLGYSFTDENIQKIITDFLSCLTYKELKNIEEHFVFISYKKHEKNLIEIRRTITTKKGLEIPITEIQTDNFSLVYDILNRITPGISPVRIRETKMFVKTIVDQSISQNDAEALILGIDALDDINFKNKPLAIAIGYKENILNKFGYGLLSDDMIFEDILFDNKHFDADEMCLSRFKSISSTRLLPVHKYMKNASVPISANEKLENYATLHNTKEKLIPSNIQKQIKTLPSISDYDALLDEMKKVDDINKKAGLLLKSIDSFSLTQIREVCQNLFHLDRNAAMKSTHFKRCVMYIDLSLYYSDNNK
ncbi:MAG: SIR2 family protein [Clostridium sp.]|nr:SIR2 family protein [Clostridium sp.]